MTVERYPDERARIEAEGAFRVRKHSVLISATRGPR